MKKSILVLSGLFLFFTVTVLESCKKPDAEKPTLLLSNPKNQDTFNSGYKIQVDGVAKDNVALSQLKIDIHDDFDGHSHGKLTSDALAFSVVRLVNLKGKEFDFNENIEIPANSLAGIYHVIVSVVDEAGNLSKIEERVINIKNSADSIAPVIQTITPTVGQTVPLNESLNIQALISDNEMVGAVKINITNEADENVYSWLEENIQSPGYELNHTANLDGLPAGNYKVEIIAIDHVNNVADVDIDIEIQ